MIEYIATVDINFSSSSIALFDANEKFITKVPLSDINSLVKNYKISTANTFGIVSSVKDSNLQDIPFKNQLARRLLLHGKFREMPVSYSETIHDSRLVNGYFLYQLNKTKKIILNCDQYTSLDLVDGNGFQGGYIMPGINHLKNAFKFNEYFKHFVDDKEVNMQYAGKLPQNNNEAIEQGMLANYYFGIKGLIKQFSPQAIYLTGQNAENVAKFLKDTCQKEQISMQLSADLIHRSLCYIGKRVYR